MRLSDDELDREYAAYGEFMKSDPGKAFRREGIAVNADGTFRIEGLPEAQYVLYITAYGKPARPGGAHGPALARVVRRVEVPPLADSEEPIDLGNGVLREIETTPAKAPVAPPPGRSSDASGIEAFLDRVEAPRPPRVRRVPRHSRNEQGEIISLRLEGVNLQKDDFALIGRLRELEMLDLNRSNVTDDDLRPLGGLPKLRELKLWGTRIDGSGLEHLGGLERLERLELRSDTVTDDSLRHLTKLRNLRHLDLTGARIGDSGLAHLARIPSLQSLKLTHTNVTDQGLRLLRGLEELRGLTLDGTKVSEAGLKSLAELPRFAWAASATATAEEFVRRIVRGDHPAVGEMHAVGLNIPEGGRFQLEKLAANPPRQADQARGWQPFHVEMHWTWEAEKLDTTFFADFVVDRAAIIVQEAGIREQPGTPHAKDRTGGPATNPVGAEKSK
jgi:hypothetical protein